MDLASRKSITAYSRATASSTTGSASTPTARRFVPMAASSSAATCLRTTILPSPCCPIRTTTLTATISFSTTASRWRWRARASWCRTTGRSTGRGNYWSDYTGYDADHDGVGDIPYAAKSLYENLMDTHPELRLFQLSPAADALDLAAKAFPIFQPQPKMADPNPLTEPPSLPPVRGIPQTPVAENLVASLGLLALALAILAAAAGTAFGTFRPYSRSQGQSQDHDRQYRTAL